MTIKTWQERMAADVQGLDKCVHMGNEIAELRVELEQAKKDADELRNVLKELDALGGLGQTVHRMIQAAIAKEQV